jgi:hypothetical protein
MGCSSSKELNRLRKENEKERKDIANAEEIVSIKITKKEFQYIKR